MREEIIKIVGRTLLDFQQQGENFAFKQLSTQGLNPYCNGSSNRIG